MIVSWEKVAEVGGAMMTTYAGTAGTLQIAAQQIGISHTLVAWWPLFATAGVGLVMWGEVRSKVRDLESKVAASSKVPERLAALEAKMDILIHQLTVAISSKENGK